MRCQQHARIPLWASKVILAKLVSRSCSGIRELGPYDPDGELWISLLFVSNNQWIYTRYIMLVPNLNTCPYVSHIAIFEGPKRKDFTRNLTIPFASNRRRRMTKNNSPTTKKVHRARSDLTKPQTPCAGERKHDWWVLIPDIIETCSRHAACKMYSTYASSKTRIILIVSSSNFYQIRPTLNILLFHTTIGWSSKGSSTVSVYGILTFSYQLVVGRADAFWPSKVLATH